MPAEPTENAPHHRRLDAQFVGGLAWTAGAKWVTQSATWLSVLIAARLLARSDFGTVEMASVVGAVTNVLAEFGIGTAVLQMRELDRRTLAQLNTVSLIFSTAAFAASAAIAPLVAAFFQLPQLKLLVIVNSLGFFITAVQAVPQGLLQRDMDYRRLSLAEAVQAIVQAVVLVGGAFAGMGYWSLLAAPLAGKGTAAALTAFWKPVHYALPRWKEVSVPMRFGLEVAASRVAWTAYSLADTVIVGRMLGASALGTYRLAIDLASAPAEKIGMLIMRVTGPLFARVQQDLALVRRYFLFISDALALTIFPLVFGLAVVAPEAVTVVLGPKWAAAIVPLQWLAAFMALRTLNTLVTQVLTSLRFTTFLMWVSLFTFTVMPVSFFVAARWGTGAVAAAWLVMSPLTILPPAVKLFRSIRCGLREYLVMLTPATAASAAMLCAVLGLRRVLPAGWPTVWILTVEVAAGGAAYAGILLGFYRPLVLRYARFLLRLRKDRGGPIMTEV
ncbi:MAG: lipopolysaccharide biosynthesis protein [Bryobacteraceae bacterium]|jgi:O-antigen/teichoic acid export membrane protein